MLFRILGPLQARDAEGRLVRLGAQKHRTLLAMLLLSANRWVAAETLTDALWAGTPPPSAASALRTYVSALRGLLGLSVPDSPARIAGRDGAYQLSLPPHELDLLAFEDLAARGQKALLDGDLPAAAESLQRALGLWRGRALEDVPHEAGLAREATRLAELRLTALEACVEARLGLGRHADVVAELRDPIEAEPLRERLQGLWLLALYRGGQQAAALAHFQAVRRQLVTELGIEPSPPLQRLHRQILAGDPALEPPERQPSAPVAPNQLPRDVAGFTGREYELAQIERLMRREIEDGDRGTPVVVAIDGVAGVGKSALAIRAAHRLADRFPDGHLYTDLHTATGATQASGAAGTLIVLSSFLRALGSTDRDIASLDEAAARFRALTASRRILVVLDNATDAAQVQRLLPAAPNCAVIATSRRVLSTLDGVAPVHLDVLPPAEAVTLVRRLIGTGRVDADPAAAADVARLCGYLPLALRIAGARLAARPNWPVRTLADRLRGAQRRLDELQAGDLGVRATFQVSLQSLVDSADPLDRAAAAAFALIDGLDGTDFGVPAAAALLAAAPTATEDALERLVDTALLASPAPGRYRLHDLLRLFAREYGEARHPAELRAAARIRALTWYQVVSCHTLRLLRPGHPHPVLEPGGPADRSDVDVPFDSVPAALAWLDTERVNLVTAVVRTAADPAVPADLPITTAQALWGYFHNRGATHDWIQVNEAALGAATRVGDRLAAGHAHRDIGVAHEMHSDFPAARAHLESGLAIFREIGDRTGEAAALTSLGVVHSRQGRYLDALGCQQRSLDIRRAAGDLGGQAVNLINLGVAHMRLARYDEAVANYQECVGIFQGFGDQRATAATLSNLGMVQHRLGRFAEAIANHERALVLLRALETPADICRGLNNLAQAHRGLADHRAALDCLGEALTIAGRIGERLVHAETLRELGSTWYALGDRDLAGRYWRGAGEIFTDLGTPEADEVAALLADLDSP